MFNLLSLPRTSWRIRLLFAMLSTVAISLVVQQWPHRHDDLAIARWMAWFVLVISIYNLPRLRVVVLFGRLPKVFATMPGRWNKTLPQIHADIARELQEQRERSRKL